MHIIRCKNMFIYTSCVFKLQTKHIKHSENKMNKLHKWIVRVIKSVP